MVPTNSIMTKWTRTNLLKMTTVFRKMFRKFHGQSRKNAQQNLLLSGEKNIAIGLHCKNLFFLFPDYLLLKLMLKKYQSIVSQKIASQDQIKFFMHQTIKFMTDWLVYEQHSLLALNHGIFLNNKQNSGDDHNLQLFIVNNPPQLF